MKLELELLIAAWDNYKKNGIDKEAFTETEIEIEDNLLTLLEESGE